MANGSNNPPEVIVNLTREEAEFIVENCDSNITMALGMLQGVENRGTAEKLVDLMEKFKKVKIAVCKGIDA